MSEMRHRDHILSAMRHTSISTSLCTVKGYGDEWGLGEAQCGEVHFSTRDVRPPTYDGNESGSRRISRGTEQRRAADVTSTSNGRCKRFSVLAMHEHIMSGSMPPFLKSKPRLRKSRILAGTATVAEVTRRMNKVSSRNCFDRGCVKPRQTSESQLSTDMLTA
jgi:hypothetical protein